QRWSVCGARLTQPFLDLRTHRIRRCHTDLEAHGFMNVGRLQPSTRPLAFKSKPQVDAHLRGRLHARECPERRDERYESLPRLDADITALRGCSDDRVIDGPELRTIRILLIDQLIGAGQNEIRIAESLHDEERLRVSLYTLTGQPRAERALVMQALAADSPLPGVHAFTGLLFEDANPHRAVALPVTRFCPAVCHGQPPSPGDLVHRSSR